MREDRVSFSMFLKKLRFGFDSYRKLNNGYFLIFKDGKAGVIKKWKVIIPVECVEIKQKNDFFVILKNGYKYLLAGDGRFILKTGSHRISHSPLPNLFFVHRSGFVGLFDAKDEVFIVPVEYTYMKLDDGFVFAKKGLYDAVFELTGKEIIGLDKQFTHICKFMDMSNIKTNYFMVKRGARSGLCDTFGNECIPCKYHRIEDVSGSVAVVTNGDGCGLVRFGGEEFLFITDPVYRRVALYRRSTPSSPAIFEVKEGDKTYMINDRSEIIG